MYSKQKERNKVNLVFTSRCKKYTEFAGPYFPVFRLNKKIYFSK